MIADLRSLIDVVVAGDDRARLRLGFGVLAMMVGDFGLTIALLLGVQARLAGEDVSPYAMLFGATVIIYWWSTWTVNRELLKRAAEASRKRVARITRRLPRLPLVEFDRLGRGVVMTRLLGDANQVAGCGRPALGVITGVLRLLIGAVVIVGISNGAAAVAFAALLLVGVAAVGQLAELEAGFGRVAVDEARQYDLLEAHVDGAVPIALHADRSSAIESAFEKLSSRVRQVRTEMYAGNHARRYMGDALVYGLLGVNVFILPALVAIDAEAVRGLNLIILWVVLGAVQLAFGLPNVASAAAALARLDDLDARLAEERIEPAVDDAALDALDDFDTISLEGLAFSYPPSHERAGFRVGPLDLTLRRGELVFVTGANGSGKSTFARVFAGLYRCQAGTISADGRVVDDARLASWRNLFTTVFVEHHVFEQTYGISRTAEARAPALLAQMDLADEVAIEGGRITERALSTGQKKRLALVLARLSNKPIVILDEWAADQDPEYRAFFYETLLPEMRDEGRLIIVVTHDDQYFEHADRGLVFADGRIVSDR